MTYIEAPLEESPAQCYPMFLYPKWWNVDSDLAAGSAKIYWFCLILTVYSPVFPEPHR